MYGILFQGVRSLISFKVCVQNERSPRYLNVGLDLGGEVSELFELLCLGCVPLCNVSEVALCLSSNRRGFRVSLGYICSSYDDSELFFSLSPGS